MRPSSNSSGSTIADIIENRSPAGPNESVQGWHKLLKEFFFKWHPTCEKAIWLPFEG